MTKVWTLSTGRYSDYALVGIYTNEELAVKVLKALDGWDRTYAEVEEWDLDEIPKEMRHLVQKENDRAE